MTHDSTAEDLAQLARDIAAAGRVTALTGAGISTESGVPDFRDEDGIWERHDPEQFHIQRFDASPGDFWADWIDLYDEVFAEDVAPNAGHEALAELVRAGYVDTVVTQNADGLHQAAGTPDDDVIELHGSTREVVCRGCHQRLDADPVRERARGGEIPPCCPDCDGVLKPGGVLFGEQLPEYAHLTAHASTEKSDAFLVVGSSLTVEPAATLPETAANHGATLAIINLEPTSLSDRADYTFRGEAGTVLPRLRDAVLD